MLEAELSTDESEREDDDYEAQCLRYGALVRRVLRSVPDLDAALPAIDEVAPGHTTTRQSTDQGLSNGRTVGVGTNGVGDTPTRTAASAPRRVFFYNFAPSVTSGDVTSCLSQYGTIVRFRLFQHPVGQYSLCAASVVFDAEADAQRALDAANSGSLRLAGVWAPEAKLAADPGGDLARRAYESHVHGPLPALLQHSAQQPRSQAQHSAGSAQSPHLSQQQQQYTGTVFVSGVTSRLTLSSVRAAFEHFGRLHGLVVHRHPTTGAPISCISIEYMEPSAALAAVRAASMFDGPFRMLGVKLGVALDPHGHMARQAVQDVTGPAIGAPNIGGGMPAIGENVPAIGGIGSAVGTLPRDPRQPADPRQSLDPRQSRSAVAVEPRSADPRIAQWGDAQIQTTQPQRTASSSSTATDPRLMAQALSRTAASGMTALDPRAIPGIGSGRAEGAAGSQSELETPRLPPDSSASTESSGKAASAVRRQAPQPHMFDPSTRTPWGARMVSEQRKHRKLWLGDRGEVQKELTGPATTLSKTEQFEGWHDALAEAMSPP